MVQNRTSHTPPGPLVVAAVVLLLALAESLVSATALQGNVRRLLGSGGTRGSDDHWESDQGDDDHRGETAGDDHLKDGISGDDARPDRPEGAAKFTVTNNAPLQCLDGKIRSATDPPTCQTFGARAAVWLSGLATAAVVGDGTYFFVVVEPDGDKALDNPLRDGSLPPTCLSTSPRATRAFRIQKGVISKVNAGTTHRLENGNVELSPFRAATNSKGRYELLICPLPSDINAPVQPSDCKSDTFYADTSGEVALQPGWCAVRIRVHKKPENEELSPFKSDALDVFTRLVNARLKAASSLVPFNLIGKTISISRCSETNVFRCSTRLQAALFMSDGVEAGKLLAVLRHTEDTWVREWGANERLGLNCLDDILLDSANDFPYCAASPAAPVVLPDGFAFYTGINDELTFRRTTPFIHLTTQLLVPIGIHPGLLASVLLQPVKASAPGTDKPWFGCRPGRSGSDDKRSACAVSFRWLKHGTSSAPPISTPSNALLAVPAFSAAAQSGYSAGGGRSAYLYFTTSRVPTTELFSTAVFESPSAAQAASDILFRDAGGWLRTYAQTYGFTCYDGAILESFPPDCAGPTRVFGGAGSVIGWSAITGRGLAVREENYSNAIGCKGSLCSVRMFWQRLRSIVPPGPPAPTIGTGFLRGVVAVFFGSATIRGGADGKDVQIPLLTWQGQSAIGLQICPTGDGAAPGECARLEQAVLTIPFYDTGDAAGRKAGAVMQFINTTAFSSVGPPSILGWVDDAVVRAARFQCYDFVTIESAPDGCAQAFSPIGTTFTGVPKEWSRRKPYPNLKEDTLDEFVKSYQHVFVPGMATGCVEPPRG